MQEPKPLTITLLTATLLLFALPTVFFGELGGAAGPVSVSRAETPTLPAAALAIASQAPAPVSVSAPGAITLSNPRAELHAEQQRITAELDVTVDLPAGIFQGKASVSGGIRPELKTMHFFLAKPVLDKLDMAALPTDSLSQVKAALAPALERYFRENPVYDPAGPVVAAVLRAGL